MQTSYTQDYVIGQVGQIADISNSVIDSFAAKGEIGFGIAVARGANRQKQVVPFAGTDFVGISVFEHNENGLYKDKDSVSVMTSGRIYVTTPVTVAAGTTAYAVNATGVITNASTAATAIGKFLTSGTGIVVLELN